MYTSHTITTVLGQKGGHWLSPSCMVKYQTVLVEQEDVELRVSTVVNPAQVLNTPMQGEEQLTHDCLQTIEFMQADQTYKMHQPKIQSSLQKEVAWCKMENKKLAVP